MTSRLKKVRGEHRCLMVGGYGSIPPRDEDSIRRRISHQRACRVRPGGPAATNRGHWAPRPAPPTSPNGTAIRPSSPHPKSGSSPSESPALRAHRYYCSVPRRRYIGHILDMSGPTDADRGPGAADQGRPHLAPLSPRGDQVRPGREHGHRPAPLREPETPWSCSKTRTKNAASASCWRT